MRTLALFVFILKGGGTCRGELIFRAFDHAAAKTVNPVV